MIIAILVFVVAGSFVSSSHVGNQVVERRYFPEEDDPFRVKHILFEDEDGVFHDEDLTVPMPRAKVTAADVTLHLYTRQNTDDAETISIINLEDLTASQIYDPTKPNIFVIHGWRNSYKSSLNTILRKAFLIAVDANVFVVDWSKIAKKFYLTAAGAVPTIGNALGDFINQMMDHHSLPPKAFSLVGHSLGAHVAGCAGAKVNGLVDYITGLDPAGPLFTLSNKNNRLDESDADFVQVLHTSGSLLSFSSSIGHADYFPNDGNGQPGCGLDLTRSCAHSRAYKYYEESLVHGGFTAVLCDNFKSFIKGKCTFNDKSYIGGVMIDKWANGDYYLETKRKPLFSVY